MISTAIVVVMVMILFLLQPPTKFDDPVVAGKALPLSTNPVRELPGLRKKDLISVMEYRTKDSIYTTRVYRYVFKGDYKATVGSFNAKLRKANGWKSAPISVNETDFWINTPKGRMVQQGLIIQAARLVKDAKASGGFRAVPPSQSKGWVWISYNEEFK